MILYLDFETTSGHPKRDSLNPWHNCAVYSYAYAIDDGPVAYVPRGDGARELIMRADYWVNHNVKYDAHVARNALGIEHTCHLIDTVTLAKLIDSDRFQHDLTSLARDWLSIDISPHEKRLAPYLLDGHGRKVNQDYGRIPHDILETYAICDVETCRKLWKYIQAKMPESCQRVMDTEILLTRRLYEMEQRGMWLDLRAVKIAQFRALNRMVQIESELAEIVGRAFRPHVSEDCNEILCGHYGLPVLAETTDDDGESTGNPSFDKHALAKYEVHPLAPQQVVQRIIEYRKLNQLNNLFLTPWQELHINGVLHPSYNQCVRTGRMSCKQPNATQLNTAAKCLIVPGDGYSIISVDQSQIEFRFVINYIQDQRAIAAYRDNPATDFHQWMADQCHIKRRPAKTLNLGSAYGLGKKKLKASLAENPDIVAEVRAVTGDNVQQFYAMCERRADEIYETYHREFPTLKRTMREAENCLKRNGYVKNLYGRRRNLPFTRAFAAFNTLCQSTAADFTKDRILAVCDAIDDTPIELIGCVHDELVFRAPTELANDKQTQRDLLDILEHIDVSCDVPIKCDLKVSGKSWGDVVCPFCGQHDKHLESCKPDWSERTIAE